MASDFFHEALNEVAGDAIDTLVVVAELRVFAFDFKVYGDAVFVAHRADFGVFDGGERVSRNRQAGDTASHGAIDVAVMQCHQRCFVAVFVVHVVDAVQGGHVLGGEPVHEAVHAFDDDVVVKHFVGKRCLFRADLFFGFFVNAAVDCVEQGFGEVGARAEELHLFANDHRADAAGDGVVVAVEVRAHQVVVFVLHG